MKFTLLRYNHILSINEQKYTFKSPMIRDYLEFEEKIINGDYIGAIKQIIPEIDKKISQRYGDIIVLKMIKLIYLIKDEDNNLVSKNKDNGIGLFFPAIIDRLCQRYNQNPIEFIEKTSISQLLAIIKGIEWNANIDNSNEDRNVFISDENEGLNFDDEIKAIREQIKNNNF